MTTTIQENNQLLRAAGVIDTIDTLRLLKSHLENTKDHEQGMDAGIETCLAKIVLWQADSKLSLPLQQKFCEGRFTYHPLAVDSDLCSMIWNLCTVQ